MIMDNMKSDRVFETELAVRCEEMPWVLRSREHQSVREPSVLDVVSKPLHKNMGKPEASAGAP